MRRIILSVIGVLLFLLSCSNNSNPVGPADGTGWVSMTIDFGNIANSRQGISAVNVNGNSNSMRIYVKMSSSNEDTIYDTIPVTSLNVNTFTKTYKGLTPYLMWTAAAVLLDEKDTIIYDGATQFFVERNKTINITMELKSRFFKIQSYFFPINSIVTKCEIIVDGLVKKDTLFNPNTHDNDTIKILSDFIPVNNKITISAGVFGVVNGSQDLLYKGDTAITLPWYTDDPVILSLQWVSNQPQNGTPRISVLIEPITSNTIYGRIGQPLYCPDTKHYYDIVESAIKWEEAKQYAQSLSYKGMKGHLAAVTSQKENEFIFKNLASRSRVSSLWIGGCQYPLTIDPILNWNWVTGEKWSYTNWSPNEPNDFNDFDETGLVMWCYSGMWNDEKGDISGFVIEYE